MLHAVGRKPKSEEPGVGNRVEHLRTQQGLTRQDLADAVGVHYQTIGYIERGTYSPSLVLALQIALVLDARIDEIFWLEAGNDE